MKIMIDTDRPLTPVEAAVLRALLGAPQEAEQPAAPPADPHPEWSPGQAAAAFLEGFSKFPDTAPHVRMAVALEACRGFLPAPLPIPLDEAVKIAADAWFAHDHLGDVRSANAAVLALATRCPRPPTAPAAGASVPAAGPSPRPTPPSGGKTPGTGA